MTPERWQKVKEIFHASLDKPATGRTAFIAQACAGDEGLRQEVESLLASSEKDGSFIDSPAYAAAAATLITKPSAELKKGTSVGAYEIVSFISRGGMGEVYLAHDRRLGRQVALKILPSSFTKNQERLRRFEQEARSASALNHPNIITIYEILKSESTHVIATEYVDGETLRDRLSNSQFELSEALNIAAQVADALSAAHKAGIIHRDIKPENIMIRQDGYVKVLDFGLAKLSEEVPSISADEAPTRQVRTGSGVIIGTAGYMSPEQARGKPVDARSDIFSLGAVIYEMVTLRKPFDGETPSDVLASILKAEPPSISQLLNDAPSELTRIVTKALKKNREERYQVAKDLLLDLKSLVHDLEFQQRLKQSSLPSTAVAVPVASSGALAAPTSSPTGEVDAAPTRISHPAFSSMIKARRWPSVVLVAIALVAVGFGLYKLLTRSKEITPLVNSNIARVTAWSSLDTQPTLSPDGKSVAYTSNHNGDFEIYVKQLTQGGREIQLTSDGKDNFQPAWSPDGQQIAYFSLKRGGIWIMPALGGLPRQVTDFGSSPAWSHDGTMIAFNSDSNPDLGGGSVGSSTIWIISARGGTPRQVTNVGSPAGGHVSPAWGPGDKKIVFIALNFSSLVLWSISIDGTDLLQLTDKSLGKVGHPVFSPDGHWIYVDAGPFVEALPVSPETGKPLGEPVKLVDVGYGLAYNVSVSGDGKRVAYTVQTQSSNIWSVSVSPKTSEAAGAPYQITNQTGTRNNQPSFSPDGRKIAFMEYIRGGGADIWVADADGKNPISVTSDPRNLTPNWFPDGDQIAFSSLRDGIRSIYAMSLQSRRERLLLTMAPKNIDYVRMSLDGKWLLFNLPDDRGVINMWVAPVLGGQPKQMTFDNELAGFGCWSPDGKFIAYQTKRGDDAYLMLMPAEGGEAIQLTSGHGRSWPYSFSPDGDKILFAGERNGIWNVYWFSRSTKQEKQITNYTKMNAFVRYPSWSPLGNQMAYEYSETTGNVWIMELK